MLFGGSDYTCAPAADELEISVFGAGFGEAIAVHVGDNVWTLIDSCVLSSAGVSAQREYLADIGSQGARVQAIVASHWDDDHVKGFAGLLATYTGADFILAGIFGHQDFLAFAAEYDMPLTVVARGGVRELYAAIKHCVEKDRSPTFAAPSRRVFSADSYSHGAPVELWTLSPSDMEVRNFLRWVADQRQTVATTRRLAIGRKRNDLSTVLLIRVGLDAMLFGGDLEEEGKPDTGWSAILNDSGRPDHKSDVFKIPHHGSKNADHPGIWKQLVVANPHVVLVPWALGGGTLPSKADVDRIQGQTTNGYAASYVASTRSIKRGNAVDKTIRQSTRSFKTARHNPGLVRLRKKVGSVGAWKCELFGAAVHLSDYLSRSSSV
jgi:beta-lactamase superfamily II metal-dependent hydrolase